MTYRERVWFGKNRECADQAADGCVIGTKCFGGFMAFLATSQSVSQRPGCCFVGALYCTNPSPLFLLLTFRYAGPPPDFMPHLTLHIPSQNKSNTSSGPSTVPASSEDS